MSLIDTLRDLLLCELERYKCPGGRVVDGGGRGRYDKIVLAECWVDVETREVEMDRRKWSKRVENSRVSTEVCCGL